jgi:hypothetical protein
MSNTTVLDDSSVATRSSDATNEVESPIFNLSQTYIYNKSYHANRTFKALLGTA